MEAMHMGDEGTVQSEVDFDASTLCCPTATIPVRDVQSLSFVKVWETILLVVFEHADGDVVHSDPDFPWRNIVNNWAHRQQVHQVTHKSQPKRLTMETYTTIAEFQRM